MCQLCKKPDRRSRARLDYGLFGELLHRRYFVHDVSSVLSRVSSSGFDHALIRKLLKH